MATSRPLGSWRSGPRLPSSGVQSLWALGAGQNLNRKVVAGISGLVFVRQHKSADWVADPIERRQKRFSGLAVRSTLVRMPPAQPHRLCEAPAACDERFSEHLRRGAVRGIAARAGAAEDRPVGHVVSHHEVGRPSELVGERSG